MVIRTSRTKNKEFPTQKFPILIIPTLIILVKKKKKKGPPNNMPETSSFFLASLNRGPWRWPRDYNCSSFLKDGICKKVKTTSESLQWWTREFKVGTIIWAATCLSMFPWFTNIEGPEGKKKGWKISNGTSEWSGPLFIILINCLNLFVGSHQRIRVVNLRAIFYESLL